MPDEVSIRAIENAWLILYKGASYMRREESFKTFGELVERLKDLLSVEYTEANFKP